MYPFDSWIFDRLMVYVAIGAANMCQWTRENDLTWGTGPDRMLGLCVGLQLFGVFIVGRGMGLDRKKIDIPSKELHVKALIFGEEIMEEEDENSTLPEEEKDAIMIENNRQMNEWKKQMKKLRNNVGLENYERILFDAALARNMAAFNIIGDPVCPMKGYIDRNYG